MVDNLCYMAREYHSLCVPQWQILRNAYMNERSRTDPLTYTTVSTVVEPSLLDGELLDLVPTPSVAYIAASWQNRFKLREIRNRLSTIGIQVSSQWIDFDRDYGSGDEGKVFETEAARDYDDIDRSDFLIIDTTDTASRGGREWEAGYATGLGLRVVRVGPIITPFHASVDESYESWDQFIDNYRN